MGIVAGVQALIQVGAATRLAGEDEVGTGLGMHVAGDARWPNLALCPGGGLSGTTSTPNHGPDDPAVLKNRPATSPDAKLPDG